MSEDFGDDDLVDPVAAVGRHDGEQFGKTGADTGAEQRRSAALACVFEFVPAVAEVVSGDEGGGRNDIHTGLEDADEFVDVDPHRVVDHGVGLEREQRVDVIGGLHAQWLDTGQFAGVRPVLSFDHA